MIHTKLQYHRPAKAEEVCSILDEHPNDAVVLGGGSWLLPRMNRHEVQANHIIDLRGLNLNTMKVEDDLVRMGAMVTYSDVLSSKELAEAIPLLPQVARGITGGSQVRNLGTLAGSACFANPSSDIPAVLVALGTKLQIIGKKSEREVAAEDFFLDAFRVDLHPGEFVSSLVIPRHRLRSGYYKLKISASSWPIATASAIINDDTGEKSITLGAVEPRPLRIDLSSVMDAEGVLQGVDISDFVRAKIVNPWSDILAAGEYRREVAGVVARRAIENLKEVRNV